MQSGSVCRCSLSAISASAELKVKYREIDQFVLVIPLELLTIRKIKLEYLQTPLKMYPLMVAEHC